MPKRRSAPAPRRFSALQRAEIAEMVLIGCAWLSQIGFSALQRAEIAEIDVDARTVLVCDEVSVLFNEPKLLKCGGLFAPLPDALEFQCSSTSRNC